MNFYLRNRYRLLVSGGLLAVFAFGCFAFGVLSARRTTEGVLLTAALFCVVVYWVKPEIMIAIALVGAFTAMPQGLHVGKVFGPVTIWAYQIAALLAILFLIPTVRMKMSDYLLPGMFTFMTLVSTVTGLQTGNNPVVVWRESSNMLEMVLGFVLAMFIVQGGYVRFTLRVMIAVLWISSALALLSSLHAISLAGRAESLEDATGAGQAVRLILSTQVPATSVLAGLIAISIIRPLKTGTYLALGLPALLLSLLSFSRNPLIGVGVAATLAMLTSWSSRGLRRAIAAAVVGLSIIAVSTSAAMVVLQNTKGGVWLNDQFKAYNTRVLGGVTSRALAEDFSARERVEEMRLLKEVIPRAPVFGHGLGFTYQLPRGADEFHLLFQPAYSENFYYWWMCKAGAVGMAVFLLFALIPVIRGLQCSSVAPRLSASVAAGLLAISAVWPLPEEPMNALGIGIALGATMSFATAERRRRDEAPPDNLVGGEIGRVPVPVV